MHIISLTELHIQKDAVMQINKTANKAIYMTSGLQSR